MATAIEVLHASRWYLESAASLSRWYTSSWSMFQLCHQAHPVRPDIPGMFSWAAVKIVSLTSLLVTG